MYAYDENGSNTLCCLVFSLPLNPDPVCELLHVSAKWRRCITNTHTHKRTDMRDIYWSSLHVYTIVISTAFVRSVSPSLALFLSFYLFSPCQIICLSMSLPWHPYITISFSKFDPFNRSPSDRTSMANYPYFDSEMVCNCRVCVSKHNINCLSCRSCINMLCNMCLRRWWSTTHILICLVVRERWGEGIASIVCKGDTGREW